MTMKSKADGYKCPLCQEISPCFLWEEDYQEFTDGTGWHTVSFCPTCEGGVIDKGLEDLELYTVGGV